MHASGLCWFALAYLTLYTHACTATTNGTVSWRHCVLLLLHDPASNEPGNGDSMGMLFLLQAGRSNGFTAGVQLRPHGPLSKPLQYIQSKDLSQMSQEIAEHLSYAVAYSPMPSTSYAGGKLVAQHARTAATVPLLIVC